MSAPKQVIFIITDTQRKDMVGCYGHPDMKTPHLDKLAAEGVRFENAYCCTPVCGPARSSLFTGMFGHSNGSWSNCMPLGDNVKTVGQRLTDQGVHAAYVGKWHLDGSDYFGLARCPDGWDPAYWYDMRCYLEELSAEDRLRSRQVETNQADDLTREFTYAHRCSNRAIDFLTRHNGEDFFLVVSYDEPHHPYLCPKPYSDMYRDYEFPKKQNVWDTLEGKPAHQRVWAGPDLAQNKDALRITLPDFLGCNSFVDDEIGRVIEAIDKSAPDALVIYTSDHGDMLFSHSLNNKGPAMYQENTNIPFIVRWPNHAPANQVGTGLISHIDVVPTVLHALGVEPAPVLQGQNLLPMFESPAQAINDTVFMEFHRYEVDHDGFGGFQPIRACFDGRYKLSINLLVTDELYDLQEDPEEMVNLIESAAHTEIRNRLHDKILDWMNQTRDPFRGYYWERRPWRTDARPATWEYTSFTRQREEDELYEPRQLDYDTGLEMTAAVRKKKPPHLQDNPPT
ncbi:MAG: DUF4976 domain-containing protein [Chloroflexi bacterium]|nr:MAG: DUF4976 domain-containing protein [Chloroflexota bacterium]